MDPLDDDNERHDGYVLVVDDDLDIRETVEMILQDHGYRTVGAANGREALELLRRSAAPKVIILDVMMPVMDGREFREKQLADGALADIPVVVITADGDAVARARALRAAVGIKKPFAMTALLDAVASSARRRGRGPEGAGSGASGP